jgi:hypothetical protein
MDVTMKNAVFWDATPCSSRDINVSEDHAACVLYPERHSVMSKKAEEIFSSVFYLHFFSLQGKGKNVKLSL